MKIADAIADLDAAFPGTTHKFDPSTVISYMHMRAIEDQTAAIREGTIANERIHERVLNTVSRQQGSA